MASASAAGAKEPRMDTVSDIAAGIIDRFVDPAGRIQDLELVLKTELKKAGQPVVIRTGAGALANPCVGDWVEITKEAAAAVRKAKSERLVLPENLGSQAPLALLVAADDRLWGCVDGALECEIKSLNYKVGGNRKIVLGLEYSIEDAPQTDVRVTFDPALFTDHPWTDSAGNVVLKYA